MDRAFELSLDPPTYRVLCVRLERLTLGHILLIARLNRPLLNGASFDAVDLVWMVFICSMPWRKAERKMRAWWYRLLLTYWGKKTRKLGLNIQEEAQLFAQYLEDSLPLPDFKFEMGQTKMLQSPWELRLLGAAMSRLHMTMDQALDTPAADIIALWTAVDEMDDKVDLWSETSNKLWEMAKQEDEQDGSF